MYAQVMAARPGLSLKLPALYFNIWDWLFGGKRPKG